MVNSFGKQVLTILLMIMFFMISVVLCLAGTTPGPLFRGDESRPADAIILFDGKDLSNWVIAGTDQPAKWLVRDGYMEVRGGTICTRQRFGDHQLHIEFWLPDMPNAQGQGKANSGVYLQSRYEIQVLDSYGKTRPDAGDCGAYYGMAPPAVNAARPPEHWQSYDIIFHAAKFDAQGNMTVRPRITVFWNGVLIHDNYEIPHPNGGGFDYDEKKPGPLLLQDHGCRVRYRNIWVRLLNTPK